MEGNAWLAGRSGIRRGSRRACMRGGVMIWRDFEAAAPELARLGRERFERTGVVLVATVRKDGSPRISPVEPYLVLGHLLLGMMWRSRKALDLLREPRCAVHSAVCDPNGSDGEFKLYGRALAIEDRRILEGNYQAWWKSQPPGTYHVFTVEIDSAAFISWDTEKDKMTVKRWSATLGLTEATRHYP
ncbi:MAG: pyridoxamine 5'-phosphate oxidase [Acidobacteria bacterium]|nr:MAG: pyridoxamine 5'-phosphate oxidase [Acidobacteriota bacterium]